jgi:hypothetical protein
VVVSNGVSYASSKIYAVVMFPSAYQIKDDPVVSNHMEQAWASTKAFSLANNAYKREEGFIITLDTASNGYGKIWDVPGSIVPNTLPGTWDKGPDERPPDSIANPTPLDKPDYVVGWFHTHTTMEFDFGLGVRYIGSSGSDFNWSNIYQLPGLVYDYKESEDPLFPGTIPVGHDTNAESTIYVIPPLRRPLP